MKKFLLVCYTLLFLSVSGIANAAIIEVINNGDFESGLTGWAIDNPGTNDLGTLSSDIDGPGSLPSSNVFYTNTGGLYGSHPVNISQSISLTLGTEYTFFSNLAAYSIQGNASGGEITATLGGDHLEFFDFGHITAEIWEYGTLNHTFTASSSGIFNLNVNIYRPHGSSTPYQYLDNISLTFDDEDSPPVPIPSTVSLLCIGLFALAGVSRRKK